MSHTKRTFQWVADSGVVETTGMPFGRTWTPSHPSLLHGECPSFPPKNNDEAVRMLAHRKCPGCGVDLYSGFVQGRQVYRAGIAGGEEHVRLVDIYQERWPRTPRPDGRCPLAVLAGYTVQERKDYVVALQVLRARLDERPRIRVGLYEPVTCPECGSRDHHEVLDEVCDGTEATAACACNHCKTEFYVLVVEDDSEPR